MWGSLSLGNAAFLGGLLALSIPVIIHLLIRRRFKKVPFSTLRFFLDRDPKLRHRSPSNLILLLLRVLLFALMVTAFSRPFMSEAGQTSATDERPRHIVLVLDNTASLEMQNDDGSRWDQARLLAQNTLRGLSPEDSVALVLASEPPVTKVPLGAPKNVARVLDSLNPQQYTGELAPAVEHALRLLQAGNLSARREIHIVSDLQTSTIGPWKSLRMPSDIHIKLSGVAGRAEPNATIEGIAWTGARRLHATVTLANRSADKPLPKRKVDLVIDGLLRSSQTVDLPPAGSEKLEFTLPELKEGFHTVEIKMATKDGFERDNIFRQVILMPEIKNVLIVEPSASKIVWEQKSYFLSRALMSSSDGNPESARFRVDTFPLDGLGIKLRSHTYDTLLIPASPEWPSDSVQGIHKHLENGGSLILFAGPDMGMNEYHSKAPWLPVKLGKEQTSREDVRYIGDYDRSFPAFIPFTRPHSGDLSMPEFTGRYLLDTVEGARVLAYYDDRVPFLVEGKFGNGRVYFVNASADTTWSNWPKLKTFLPWLHGLTDAALGAGSNSPEVIRKPHSVTMDAKIKARSPGEDFLRMITPENKEMILTNDVRVELTQQGFYRLENTAGQVIDLIAVNSPAAESEMTTANPASLMKELPSISETPVSLLDSITSSREPGKYEFWPWILLAGLCIMIVEPLIANRT